jgi:hypothetical protein
VSDYTWQEMASPVSEEDDWLCAVDTDSSVVLALIDPFCKLPEVNPNEAEVARNPGWRLARFPLTELLPEDMLLPELAERLDQGTLTAMASVRRELLSIEPSGCSEVLALTGDRWRSWIEEHTEDALVSLEDIIGYAPIGGVCSAERLEAHAARLDGVRELLAEWKECGGRHSYLRRIVTAIDSRRSGLLEVMKDQPTTLSEWAELLRHRMIDHALAFGTGQHQLDHGAADHLAWTAAMALEAAFVIMMCSDSELTIEGLINDAAAQLEEDLAHGHDNEQDWLVCGAHRAADLERDLNDAGHTLELLLCVYAHLAGAIVAAGCVSCVLHGHSGDEHDD